MYRIISKIGPFAACIIQLGEEDLIFHLDEIENDLRTLNINGEILFDRLPTTGNTFGRLSSTSFIRGKFLNRNLKVIKDDRAKFIEPLIEPYRKN